MSWPLGHYIASVSLAWSRGSEAEVEAQDEVRWLREGLELRRRVAAVADSEVALRIDAAVLGPLAEVPRGEHQIRRAGSRARGQTLRHLHGHRCFAPFHESTWLIEAIERLGG